MNFFKFLFSKPDESTNDKLGAYPEKVHVRAMPERRYLKTSRSMTLMSVGLLCSMIALTFIVYLLGPLLRAEPMLLAIDKRFYKLEPVQRSVVITQANEMLLETYIQEYIRLMYTYVSDIDAMNERWGENSYFYWFSSPEVYQNFKLNKEKKIQQILNGLTVEVDIRFVQRIFGLLWICEFDTIEHRPEDEYPTRKRWRAYMEVGYMPRAYPNRDERIKNAVNFRVTSFYVGSRGIHADDRNAKFID